MSNATRESGKTQRKPAAPQLKDPFGMPITRAEWKRQHKYHLPMPKIHRPGKPIVVRTGLTKAEASMFMANLIDALNADRMFIETSRTERCVTGRRISGVGFDVQVWVSVSTYGECTIVDCSPRRMWPENDSLSWVWLLTRR